MNGVFFAKGFYLGLLLGFPSVQSFLDKLRDHNEWKGRKVSWMTAFKLRKTFFFKNILNIYFDFFQKRDF